VQIDPEGHMIVVGGKNGQGKTSTLDAIWYALGGKGALPSEPLRKGAEKGFAKLTLDNGLIITRRVTKKGTTLKVETAEGLVHSSPQQMLDGMVGAISFDPMAFARMDARQQLEQLRKLLGVDTAKLDKERQEQYAIRTTYNRKIKDLRVQLGSIIYSAGGPDEEVSVSLLMVQLEEFEAAQLAHVDAMTAIEELETELYRQQNRLEDLEGEIKLAKVAIKAAKARLPRMKKAVAAMSLPDPDAVRDQISKADEVNRNVRAKAQHKVLLDRANKGEDEVTKMNQKIDDIDEQKRELLASAKFPVEGLSFDSETVRFNDIPFDQCSSAEQTRVSVGMALAMNPELQVLLIRDGSLLDDDSFKLIAEMAAEADAQVWVEAVSTDEKKCAVIIEDGSVK
jgi:DNA repair exonuclease SbcCD ATPase subunit